jgi:hypothetical protein
MSGSIRNFRYVADDGSLFAIKLDESNTEAINGASATAIPPQYGIPKNLKPRYGLFISSDRLSQRKAYFLTQADFAAASNVTAIIADGVEHNLSYKVGERQSLYRNVDTGKIDGDNP